MIYNSIDQTMTMVEKISFVNGTTHTHCITLDELSLVKENFALQTKGSNQEQT